MRIIAITAVAAIVSVTAPAFAADVLSHESVPHKLTVTDKSGSKTVEIAAKGDIRDICNGCVIALENGQMVEPNAGDIVFLMDGKLEIYSD